MRIFLSLLTHDICWVHLWYYHEMKWDCRSMLPSPWCPNEFQQPLEAPAERDGALSSAHSFWWIRVNSHVLLLTLLSNVRVASAWASQGLRSPPSSGPLSVSASFQEEDAVCLVNDKSREAALFGCTSQKRPTHVQTRTLSMSGCSKRWLDSLQQLITCQETWQK